MSRRSEIELVACCRDAVNLKIALTFHSMTSSIESLEHLERTHELLTAFSVEGVIANENCRGIRWRINDVTLHTDAIHRGGGQIIPTARRVLYASQMMAEPRFLEPVYLVEIQCPGEVLSGVSSAMNARRGNIFEQRAESHHRHTTVQRCTGYLRKATGGQAFLQCVFDHWQVMNYDPLAVHPQDMKDPAKVKQFYDNNQAYKIMMKIRKRRGLNEEQPKLDDYFDRM
ncbi:elongation factor 2-like [Symsagittifera roscoffensis]|uniref:elongation factor 2-like n=1 Tax=Symsagittifera roscoffensis TaxID=84072 RepID=UPI00307BA550